MRGSPKIRLLAKYTPDAITGCWRWTAYKNPQGYGTLAINRRMWLAHRVSWEVHHGPIPSGMDVLHRCDNPSCINPDHLFLGTDFDNQRDRVKKGRHKGWPTPNKGSDAPMAKLTDMQVFQIREEARTRKYSQTKIAAQFGISQSLVSMIHKRKIWAHLADA